MNEKNKEKIEEKVVLPPPLDEGVRQQIRRDLLTSMFIEGASGTGKTHLLVGRIVDLVAEEGVAAASIIVLAASEEAATQIRRQLRVRLLERADEETIKANAAGVDDDELFDRVHILRATAERSGQCFIGTLPGFCAKLIREQTKAARYIADFRQLDSNSEYCLRRRAWDEFMANLHTTSKGRQLYLSLREVALEADELWTAYGTIVERADVDEWPTKEIDKPKLEDVWQKLHHFLEPLFPLLPDFPIHRGSDELMNLLEEAAYSVDAAGYDVPEDTRLIIDILEKFSCTPLVIEGQWPSIEAAFNQQRRFANFRVDVVEPFLSKWHIYAYHQAIQFLKAAKDWYDGTRVRERLLSDNDIIESALRLLRECDDEALQEFRKLFKIIFVDGLQHFHPLCPELIALLSATEGSGRKWTEVIPRIGSLFITGDERQSIDSSRAMNLDTYRAMRKMLGTAGAVVQVKANFRAQPELNKFIDCACGPNFPDPPTKYSPSYHSMVTAAQHWSDDGLTGVFAYDVPGVASVAADGSMKFAQMVPSKVIQWEAPFLARTIWHLVDKEVAIKRRATLDEALKGGALRYSDFLIITQRVEDIPRYAEALREFSIPHHIVGKVRGGDLVEFRLLRNCIAAVVSFDDEAALVTTLRSELFGISDRELYEYRLAGGRFSVFANIPQELGDKTLEKFQHCLGRLKKYALWFEKLLPIAALRSIFDDLGLAALAASYRNGRQRVKGLYEILDCVRREGHTPQTTTELLEQLDMVLAGYTSQPVLFRLTGGEESVCLASLESACHLSTPVVFLAGVASRSDEDANLHIAKEENKVCGYKVLKTATSQGRMRVLAVPPGWQEKQSTERLTLQAEKNRRIYLAATRAQTVLSIVRHSEDSVWADFKEPLKEAEPLPKMKGRRHGHDDFKPLADREMGYRQRPSLVETKKSKENLPVVAEKQERVSSEDEIAAILTAGTPQPKEAKKACQEMAAQWQKARASAYPVAGKAELPWQGMLARFLSKSDEEFAKLSDEMAAAEASAMNVTSDLATDALAVCQQLRKTKLWQEVKKAKRVLIEAPFYHCVNQDEEDGPKTLHQSCVDLAFESEEATWTLVGLNTIVIDNSVEGEVLYEREVERMHELRNLWERDTGAWVSELAVLFTDGLPDESLAYQSIWKRPPEELVVDEEVASEAAPIEAKESETNREVVSTSDGPLWSDKVGVLLSVFSQSAAQYVEKWSRESALPEPKVGVEVEADGHAVATALLMWRKGKTKVALMSPEDMPAPEILPLCQGWELVEIDWEQPFAWYEQVKAGLQKKRRRKSDKRRELKGPQFYLTKSFTSSLAILSSMNQARVIEGLVTVIGNAEEFKNGLSTKFREDDQQLYSLSLSSNLQALVTEVDKDWYFLWAGNAEDENLLHNTFVVDKNKSTGSHQLYHHPDTVKLSGQLSRRASVYEKMESEVPDAIFASVDEMILSGWGVPSLWTPLIKAIQSREELAEIISALPEEGAEALLCHLAAQKVFLPLQSLLEEEDQLSFDEKRRFYHWQSRKAVKHWQKVNWLPWMEFLHPLQQEAVRAKCNRPVIIEGGIGTGKTTVLALRARHLLNQSKGEGRILTLTPTESASRYLESLLRTLCTEEEFEYVDIHSIDEMAEGILHHAEIVNPVSVYGAALGVLANGGFDIHCRHILVDDFQDMERAAIRLIAQLAEEAGSSLTLVGDEKMRTALPAFEWAEAGVAECTHCQPLIRDYRSSSLIRLLANHVSKESNLELGSTVSLIRGVAPRIRGFSNATEEASWLAEIIVGLVEDKDVSLHRIAIIAPTEALLAETYISTFERMGIQSVDAATELARPAEEALRWSSYETLWNVDCDHLFLISLERAAKGVRLVKAIMMAQENIALSYCGEKPDFLQGLSE